MVRLIMGANGAGKTKQLIELIHAAVESENGSVVCIAPSADMPYDSAIMSGWSRPASIT